MTKKTLYVIMISGFFLSGIASPSFSQTTPSRSADVNADVNADIDKVWFMRNPREWPMEIRPGARAGRDRTQWYTDMLWPFAGFKDAFMFVNPKFASGAKDSNEQNVGTGVRWLMFDEELMAGGNFFYDTRRTENKNRFHQLGWGTEFFTKWVDARANFYWPLSKKVHMNDDVSYRFASSSLRKVTTSNYEEPMTGYDCEVGFLVPFVSDYLETRIFCGWYQYFSEFEKKALYGLRGRMEIRPVPALTFDLEIASDKFEMKNTNVYLGGYITVPLDIGNLLTAKNPFEGWQEAVQWKKGTRSLRKRMTDKVIRDIDIVLDAVSTAQDEKEHDVVYVDKAGGNDSNPGTLESPKATVQGGVNSVFGDKWVYVKQGGSDYAENVTLTDGVTLWGSRYNGGFSGISSDSGPVINKAGSVVTLASNTTVMGFTLTGGTKGITSDDDNDNSNITIKNNVITANARGIDLEPRAGETYSNIVISDNTITLNNTAVGSAGIWMDSYGTVTGLTITRNDISSNGSGGAVDGGILMFQKDSGGGTTGVVISNNTINDSNIYGVVVANAHTTQVTEVSLSRNVITGSSSYGIVMNGTGGASIIIDAGGGSLGAEGYNSIYNNTTFDVIDATGTATILAKYNWWGTTADPAAQFSCASIDYTPWLTSDPN